MSVLTLQRPRIAHFPEATSSAGAEAVDLAAMAGLELDPWQALVLEHSLSERPDGKWAAFEVGIVISRQNGKGSIEEARELAGLFLLGERLIIHSAHQFDTSLEAFRRLLFLVENTPELSRKVKRVSRAHGEEGIELTSGQRVRFRTRTKGGGRGFTADCLILDEAMILPEAAIGAILPTLSARPNPQVYYAGSAVDQEIHEHGLVLARLRERAVAGTDESLAYFEWSAEPRTDEQIAAGEKLHPSQVTEEIARDPESWAAANPALGIRISESHIEKERRSMDPRTFAVERLGVGDWPETDPDASAVIDVALWRSLADAESAIEGPVSFSFDVTPDRGSSSICAGGRRSDGQVHVEVIEQRPGTGWVAARLVELTARHESAGVVCDGLSPAASLVADIEHEGVMVTQASTSDYVKACGLLFDMVVQERIRHLGTRELDTAIRGATKRPLVDAWAWSRKSSRIDISPLVAATLAAWLADQSAPAPFIL